MMLLPSFGALGKGEAMVELPEQSKEAETARAATQ
jgi:hypothetical protein